MARPQFFKAGQAGLAVPEWVSSLFLRTSRPSDQPTAEPAAPTLAVSGTPSGERSDPILSATTSAAAATPRTDNRSDLAVHGDLARPAFGVTGAGVKIGILSDSFDLRHMAATDVANGDLPASVQILEEGPAGGHDEGRAMAELVHRIAPGATILFHTATAGQQDFADGIRALADAGCTVIVDDVVYLEEPFYQDGGIIQVAVEQVVARGVSYFTSASNEGSSFFESTFKPLQTALLDLPGRWTVADLGTSTAPSPTVDLTMASGASCTIDLQWDQPFASIGSGAGSANSLALALYSQDGRLVATAGFLTVASDPVQTLSFTNTTGQTHLRLAIISNGAAPPPTLFKFIVYGQAMIDSPGAGIGSGSIIGHELVPTANTVGAIGWWDTPRHGGRGHVESFSSPGRGKILFNAAGDRLATPIDAGKVNFVAPDGSFTSVFAPFSGTSAAAPNAAAIAALMLQANPDLTPADISRYLASSAATLPDSPALRGAGLVQADAAVSLAIAASHHGSSHAIG